MTEYSSLHNCVTGDNDHLFRHLKYAIRKAEKIDIIVAFLMESGVRMLSDDLYAAVNRGARIRILCGNYLNITQPQALYLLKDALEDKVDLRFYNVANKSFHPKAYIFEHEEKKEIFVGSSNISRSALTSGIEWNYRICSQSNPEDYNHFKKTFEDLFLNYSIVVDDNELRRYSMRWKKPILFDRLEEFEDNGGSIAYPRPMGAQIEALYELKKSRLEGWDKGLVVAATGVGKTYLAAFDSKEYKKILFVAHREEILSQAEATFNCVRPDLTTGYFNGTSKDSSCDILFATAQTIGRKEYLCREYFREDEFEYIIVDEFHHAVADNYKNIIGYFRPLFLLGLTATPERLDGRDVFAMCDFNLVYEIRLKEAINKGLLVPFRYYGIYDETDYDKIEFKNGSYDAGELEELLSINKRCDLVLSHYSKYNSRRALGFCSGRNHAVFMANFFVVNKIKARAVISGNVSADNLPYVTDRKTAVEMLVKGNLQVIFTVDMFNEGLDIPETDMIMFLRPTQSPTIFLQQLGRGLRKRINKKYVNILDFIGNYRKANLVPFFLTGDIKSYPELRKGIFIPHEVEYPDGCIVDFDFKLIDLFKRMAQEQKNIFERISNEYFRVKEHIGRRPLRLEMYTYMDEMIYTSLRSKKQYNIFSDFISFLDRNDELSDEEKDIRGTFAHEFLKEIENTGMTKMYKMPVFLAFYNKGNMKVSVTDEDIYLSFKEFYSRKSNGIDMLKDASTRNYAKWEKKDYIKLARQNPVHFLLKTSSRFFYEKNGSFCLNESIIEYIDNPSFVKHFKDIIDFRTRKFYSERLEKMQAELLKED